MTVPRGVTLVDTLVGVALIVIIFTALIGLLRASLLVSAVVKARTIATTLADTQMEYVRSLSYDNVGTLGGIPAGTIPQVATTTLNGIGFTTRTFIEYVDDVADGLAASDTNNITTDYKRIKVAVTYTVHNTLREVDVISNYAPSSIETTTGGGTLKVNVVGATGSPVAGASVRVVNASTTPTVDLTTFSDATGVVYLPGAATSSQYQITVSKTGYSTAKTYTRDTTNQNPTPGYLTVIKNQTTSSTFAIDALTTLIMKTFSPIQAASSTDLFTNAARVTTTNTSVTGGALTLLNTAGSYALSGSAVSTTTSPQYLAGWASVQAAVSKPAGTSVLVQVLDGGGALLPDSVLPGNAAGFATFPVSLAAVSTTTYPTLSLKVLLSTNATSTTPQLLDWTLAYSAGPTPLPNVSFTLTGAKTIGTTGSGLPIYKTTVATSTDSTGTRTLSLEWDSYTLSLSSYTIATTTQTSPYTLSPGATLQVGMQLTP